MPDQDGCWETHPDDELAAAKARIQELEKALMSEREDHSITREELRAEKLAKRGS